MAVIPADEGGGAVYACLVVAGDAEVAVERRADREDHRVVHALQLVDRDVAADLDIAEEADGALQGRFLVGAPDGLRLLVVRRDAAPDQAERRRQALDDVDPAVGRQLQEGGNRVEAARPGADHRYVQRHEASLPWGFLCGVSYRRTVNQSSQGRKIGMPGRISPIGCSPRR